MPLFHITNASLGAGMHDVENGLREVFYLATRWNTGQFFPRVTSYFLVPYKTMGPIHNRDIHSDPFYLSMYLPT